MRLVLEHWLDSIMLLVVSGIVAFTVFAFFNTKCRDFLRVVLMRVLQILERNKKESQPTYPDMLLFHNVPEDVSENSLKRHLTRLTGSKVVKLLFADDEGVLVTFNRRQDLTSVKKECQDPGNALNGHQLSVSKVPKCDAILVENLNPATSKESLELFFGNKRNSGVYNGLQRVNVYSNQHMAVITFKNHEVVDNVMEIVETKSMTLESYRLKISPYFECLGLSAGNSFQLPLPQDMNATELDDYIYLQFLRKCPAFWKKLRAYLSVHHAEATFVRDASLQLTCTLTPDVPRAHKIARTWAPHVQQAITKYLSKVKIHKVPIPSEDKSQIWDVVKDLNHYDFAIVLCEDLGFVQPGSDKNVVIVGVEPYAAGLKEKVKVKVKENRTIVEKRHLCSYKFRLLELHSFHTKQADVRVTMNNGDISFHGTSLHVKECIRTMESLLQSVQKTLLSNFSQQKSKLKVLQQKEVISMVENKFRQEKLVAVWEVDNWLNEVNVFAFSIVGVGQASKIIEDTIVECILPFPKQSETIFQNESWKKLMKKLENQVPQLDIIINENNKLIVLTGTNSAILSGKNQIKTYIENNTLLKISVCFQPNWQTFIVSMWMEKQLSNQICQNLTEEKVEIKPDSNGKYFVLKGTLSGLTEAEKRLCNLGKNIVVEKKTFTSPHGVKYLQHKDGKKVLKSVGKSHNCLITFQGELKYQGLMNPPCNEEQTDPIDSISESMTVASERGPIIIRQNKPATSEKGPFFVGHKDISAEANVVDLQRHVLQPVNTSRIITVKLVEGTIADEQADVIVNSTQQDLNLGCGAVSSSILGKAGPGLQLECRTKYPRGIMVDDIAFTRGYGLQCKEVFHLTLLSQWSSNVKQNLGKVITKCLTEASNKGYTSLVFPALGTGNLDYPREETALLMLQTIDSFQGLCPATSLRDVRIVIYQQDAATMQDFERVHNRFTSSHKSQSPIKYEDTQNIPSFVTGEIAQQMADVIVNTVDKSLDLTLGGVSSSILREAGPRLQDECSMNYPTGVPVGSLFVTNGYGLNCKAVFHLALRDWSPQFLRNAVTKCLTKASSQGYTSLVFPALGTGNLGYPRLETARLMLESITSFHQSNPTTSLKDVRVVVYQQDTDTVQEFSSVFRHGESKFVVYKTPAHSESRMDRKFFNSRESCTQPGPVLTPKQQGSQELTASRPTGTLTSILSVELFFYAERTADIQRAIKTLEEKAMDTFKTVILEEESLNSLAHDVIQQILEAGREHNVDVTLHEKKHLIQLFGHVHDIIKAQSNIKDLIKNAEKTALQTVEQRRRESEMEDFMASLVQWFYLEVTNTGHEPMPYGKTENKIIEEAFQNKEPFAKIITTDRTVYIIDLEKMIEYPQVDKDNKVFVIRREKTGADHTAEKLPDFWQPMTPSEGLTIVNLKPTDKEYTDVKRNFKMNLKFSVTILAIARVQNRMLMTQYLSKKTHMIRQNQNHPQNERTLWHGTEANATQSINQDGFNRSYCGKNATLFGQGVYFAVNSNYSADPTYSPPENGTGKCCVYQCKVLTGHFVQADITMRYLPKRAGTICFDSATDNVHVPGMFIIFSDSQAYPEYLITFRRK